jgi:hypothetical protein
VTTIEAAVRAMARPERVAHLRARGWHLIGYSGAPQRWLSPDPQEHATFYTLAAAIREQVRRERRAALPSVNGAPVVPVKRRTTDSWVIDCPYCGREHTHGAAPGHRAPHCHQRRPGSDRGYFIERPDGDEDWA